MTHLWCCSILIFIFLVIFLSKLVHNIDNYNLPEFWAKRNTQRNFIVIFILSSEYCCVPFLSFHFSGYFINIFLSTKAFYLVIFAMESSNFLLFFKISLFLYFKSNMQHHSIKEGYLLMSTNGQNHYKGFWPRPFTLISMIEVLCKCAPLQGTIIFTNDYIS